MENDSMRRRLAVFVVFSLVLISGCRGSKMPKLNPVTGHATRSGTPVQHVRVQLSSDDLPGFTISGISDSSGDIEISTIEAKTNLVKTGAPAGEYAVIVTPPVDEQQRGGAAFKLPQKFTVVAGDNTLPRIDLDAAKK